MWKKPGGITPVIWACPPWMLYEIESPAANQHSVSSFVKCYLSPHIIDGATLVNPWAVLSIGSWHLWKYSGMITMLLPSPPPPPSVVCVVWLKHWWCQSNPMLGGIYYEADLKPPWLWALTYDSVLKRFPTGNLYNLTFQITRCLWTNTKYDFFLPHCCKG